jgi:hypothetical protein
LNFERLQSPKFSIIFSLKSNFSILELLHPGYRTPTTLPAVIVYDRTAAIAFARIELIIDQVWCSHNQNWQKTSPFFGSLHPSSPGRGLLHLAVGKCGLIIVISLTKVSE